MAHRVTERLYARYERVFGEALVGLLAKRSKSLSQMKKPANQQEIVKIASDIAIETLRHEREVGLYQLLAKDGE